MFEVMKFASLMHRATNLDPSIQPAHNVVRHGDPQRVGRVQHEGGHSLPVARRTSSWSTPRPVFTRCCPDNKEHLYSHLVFAANGSCVDTTIIDGRVVMQGRQLAVWTRADRAGGQRGIPAGPGAGERGLGRVGPSSGAARSPHSDRWVSSTTVP